MGRYYEEVYLKRLNRYGLDFQSRMKGQREKDFENYLLRSVFRVDFEFEGELVPGSLERLKQDYSETQCYLLTRTETKLPNGTILNIISKDGHTQLWMVWWLEQIEASGYNRYIVLRLTHCLEWLDADDNKQSQWGYFSGPGTALIQDVIKTSTAQSVYKENNNLHQFVTPYNSTLQRDTYFEVSYKETTQGYVIAEFDVNSTPGVSYITVDPVPVRNLTPPPAQESADEKEEFFWLNGGINNA